MLELCNSESKIVRLLTPHEPETPQGRLRCL